MHIGFKKQYFQELADLEVGNFWFCARNRLILWALNKYSPKFKSFLEIGCGTGFVIAAIAREFPGAAVVGSEYLGEGLVFARQRAPTVNFVQMDARRIPYESEFDAIGVFDVLEHIEDDILVLQQIYKALKAGGILYVTVPQHKWLWSSADDYACHVRRYSNRELCLKVNAANFEIIHSTSFVSILLPAMYITRFFKKNQSNMGMKDISGLHLNSILNTIFRWILNFERLLICLGIKFPLGGSRLLVARKPKAP